MIKTLVSIARSTRSTTKGSALMDAPRPSQTNLAELLEWRETQRLVLTPKFQRRPVWKLPQKSYFIDTMLQEMPSPQVYLRNVYDLDRKKGKIIHEVIDGQQRFRAVLDFYDGEYALDNNLESPYRGRRFDELSKEQQMTILKYKFNTESFEAISDRDVHDVFRRMNTFSMPLNAQELRHGRWFGHFSRACERLAGDYL